MPGSDGKHADNGNDNHEKRPVYEVDERQLLVGHKDLHDEPQPRRRTYTNAFDDARALVFHWIMVCVIVGGVAMALEASPSSFDPVLGFSMVIAGGGSLVIVAVGYLVCARGRRTFALDDVPAMLLIWNHLCGFVSLIVQLVVGPGDPAPPGSNLVILLTALMACAGKLVITHVVYFFSAPRRHTYADTWNAARLPILVLAMVCSVGVGVAMLRDAGWLVGVFLTTMGVGGLTIHTITDFRLQHDKR